MEQFVDNGSMYGTISRKYQQRGCGEEGWLAIVNTVVTVKMRDVKIDDQR